MKDFSPSWWNPQKPLGLKLTHALKRKMQQVSRIGKILPKSTKCTNHHVRELLRGLEFSLEGMV